MEANHIHSADIQLGSLFKMIFRKIWLVILLSVLFASLGFAWARYTYVPQYTVKVTLFSSNRTAAVAHENGIISNNDLQASQQLANTFAYILMRDAVLSPAIQAAGLNMSPESVRNHIKIKTFTGTTVLEMTVTFDDPQTAYVLARGIRYTYEGVLDKVVEMGKLKVIDEPQLPLKADPYSATARNTALGFVGGMVLACAIIMMMEYFSHTIKTQDDLINKVDTNLLGLIPYVEKSKMRHQKLKEGGPFITDALSGFNFIETYKAIRTKVEIYAKRNQANAFVVTSTLPNEGKSTFAANLALALSQNNKKVILVDCDLRKPTVNSLFQLDSETNYGVVQVLEGKLRWKSSVHYLKEFNLSLLVAGTSVDDSSEILSSPLMETILQEMRQEFDYIIIDSPPINVVTDPAIIARYTDASILIVKPNYAKIRDIQQALNDLSESGDVVGTVLNGVRETLSLGGYGKNGYNNYGSKYGYGYGYGYQHRRSDKSNVPGDFLSSSIQGEENRWRGQ